MKQNLFSASTDLPEGWTLVWHDEFYGPAGLQPDAARWQFDLGSHVWGNQEWQCNTKVYALE